MAETLFDISKKDPVVIDTVDYDSFVYRLVTPGASKCVCTKCMSIWDVDKNSKITPACSDCGNDAVINEPVKDTVVIKSKNGSAFDQKVYRIPPFIRKRELLRSDTDHLNTLYDNITISYINFDANLNLLDNSQDIVISEVLDLDDQTAFNKVMSVKDNNKTVLYSQPYIDTFKYPDFEFFNGHINRAHVYKGHSDSDQVFENSVINSVFFDSGFLQPGNIFSKIPGYQSKAEYSFLGSDVLSDSYKAVIRSFDESSLSILRDKLSLVSERFKDKVDPFYLDFHDNGLFLSEHKLGSNESNMSLDKEKMSLYGMMMVKYPMAFVYACDRTDDRIKTWIENEDVKCKDDSTRVRHEMKDSIKAKMFRDEVARVAEQLSGCDDNITEEVARAKSLYELKKHLEFNLFGNLKDFSAKGSSVLRPDTDFEDNIVTHVRPLFKDDALVDIFNNDMLATASNVYTLRKMGISHEDQMVEALDLIGSVSDKLKPRRIRSNGRDEMIKPSHVYINENVLLPLKYHGQIGFVKNYVTQALQHGSLTDCLSGIYNLNDVPGSGKDGFIYNKGVNKTLDEAIKVYTDVIDHGKIVSSEMKDYWKDTFFKPKLSMYLKDHSVSDACDFYSDKLNRDASNLVMECVHELDDEARLQSVHDNYLELKNSFSGDDFCDFCNKHKDAIDELILGSFTGDVSFKPYESETLNYIKDYLDDYVSPDDKWKGYVAPSDYKVLFNGRSTEDVLAECKKMAESLHDNIPEVSDSGSVITFDELPVKDAVSKEIMSIGMDDREDILSDNISICD